jgi:hypothetical protein
MPEKQRARAPTLARIEQVERSICLVRGQRVIVDHDLAPLYGTTTARLNEQVRRNIDRFPDDFSFLLARQEVADLKTQIAISSWGGRRSLVRAFTEHGAVMVASVLKTPAAIAASILVVRAFVAMRRMILDHRELAQRLIDLEKTVGRHDQELRAVFAALRQLLDEPVPPRRRIGFHQVGEPGRTGCARP